MSAIAVCACGRVYRAAPVPVGWRCHWYAVLSARDGDALALWAPETRP